jgi:hypothetical protein
MRVVETTVYQYSELSERAKSKARDWYREASADDNHYSETVLYDALQIAEILGIEFKTRDVKTYRGKVRQEPAIYWTGFASQGDGACFEGKLVSHETGTALDRIKAYAPTDETLHAIAAELDALQETYQRRLAAAVTLSGHRYCHSGMMQVDVTALDADGDEKEVTREDEITAIKALRGFADWIYLQLQNEYFFSISDENVAETIAANEYEFTADGERFD